MASVNPVMGSIGLKIIVAVLVALIAGSSYYAYGLSTTNANLNDKIASLESATHQKDSQVSQLQSQLLSLNQTYNSVQAQVTQLQAQISSLQNTNSQLTGQISTLQAQVVSLQSTISQLNAEITSLQTQLASLQAPYMVSDFTWSNSCAFLGNCNFLMNGAYANVGSNKAHSVSISFTFYSGSSQTGQVLCTTTYVAGDVAGRTVLTMPQVTCTGSSSTSAVSASYQFSYT